MSLHFKCDLPGNLTCLSNNSGRRLPFRTITVLQELDSAKAIYKLPASPDASEFIYNLFRNHSLACDYLGNNFTVAPPALEHGGIRFDYLTGINLEDAISRDLLSNDFNSANQLFTDYIKRIISLKVIRTAPLQFYKQFALNGPTITLDCLSLGVIDLIPRNIMIVNGNWVVIDNEWLFNFPVPREYLIFRTLQKLAAIIQPAIRSVASQSIPLTGLFKLGMKTLYLPKPWLDSVRPYCGSFKTMLNWEIAFQKYVTGSYPRIARLKSKPDTLTSSKTRACEKLLLAAASTLKRLPGLQTTLGVLDRAIVYSSQRSN
ncbi:MAG: hypothetical protein A2Y07_04050 [Planctomycetes bacterium GWF2_50_10]|nr:MAG: hypothetical protein A2Y07_04050 [Planctomycetes bacterium GWF2_50_10]